MPLSGAHTTPALNCLDFSGLSLGSPPVRSRKLVLQSSGRPVVGQRNGSSNALPVNPSESGVYRSYKVGARKPVPQDERSRISLTGCHRTATFGFTVLPKSL